MNLIYFTSKLKIKYKEDLEQILFFNRHQKDYVSDISDTITLFGVPIIILNEGYIKILVEKLKDVQSIFVMDGQGENANLLGVLLYYRLNYQEIIILHIAVVDECSAYGKFSDELILLRLINNLKLSVKKIKGVERILFSYNRKKRFTVIKI